MLTLLRTLMLLCLIIWMGGIIFFSAIEAPALFQVLSAPEALHFAGDIVNRSLSVLHYTGMLCGIVFLVCMFAVRSAERKLATNDAAAPFSLKALEMRMVFVSAMILVTMFSQFWIAPTMHIIRESNPQMEQMPAAAPARVQFARLHRYSTYAEGTVLLLGLGVVVLTARRLD